MKAKFLSCLFVVMAMFHAQANAVSTALLYNGTGSSPTDVAALANILNGMGIIYDLVSSAQMNAMSKATIASYKLIIFPGGNSIDMGNSLTRTTTANVKAAVSTSGVSYIGFCAGAFMAESSTMYNVFNLAGTWFDFYNPTLTDMVWATLPNGVRKHLVFWQGPHVTGFGSVLAKYPNGQAAIAASKVGKGFVVVSGLHPEAPENWRYGFATPDADGVSTDVGYAATLINSALTKTLLPHF